jgi:hypothetical protein
MWSGYFRIKWIIICGFVLCIPSTYISALVIKDPIAKAMDSIPLQDRKILEEFFRKLLFSQGFAFALFGDKPISVEYFDLEEKKKELFSTSPEGYKTWKKYVHLFPSRNYLFIFHEDLDKDECEITLINKKAFHQAMDKHREKFAEVLGPKMDSDTLLNLIVKKKSLWNTPIKDRDDLTGILLGYGKHNADLFHKRSEIEIRNRECKRKRTEPSPGYSTVEEELEILNTSLQSFSNEERVSLRLMRLPGFVADPKSEETNQLKKKYTQQRRRITQRFARGKILEITLKQLCSESPIDQ